MKEVGGEEGRKEGMREEEQPLLDLDLQLMMLGEISGVSIPRGLNQVKNRLK